MEIIDILTPNRLPKQIFFKQSYRASLMLVSKVGLLADLMADGVVFGGVAFFFLLL